MNLDERRAPRPRLRAKILERTLVRLSERRFEITVAHDIRHAERSRCPVEVAALAGDDAALCIAAFVAYAGCDHYPHPGSGPFRFGRVVPHEGRGYHHFGRGAEQCSEGARFFARCRGHLIHWPPL